MSERLNNAMQEAYACCVHDDYSVERTIQYIIDATGATHDQVVDFLEAQSDE